ncbi:MAG: hypothetical protein LW853_01765 [Rickettsiales bacterium]|jgi:hypothetical protein|nr:hypothetical protein [Rickettsiales bacterium]
MNLANLNIPEIKVLGEVRHFKGTQGDKFNTDLRAAKDNYKVWLNLEIQRGGQKGWQLLECEYSARDQFLDRVNRYAAKGGNAAIDLTKFGKSIGEFTSDPYAAEYLPRQRSVTNQHGRKGAEK